MKTKNETDTLNALIISKEKKRAYQLELLQEQLPITCQSLKPLNLIKNAFQEVIHSPEIKHSLVNWTIGLGTGFLSKKLIGGNAKHPVKRVLGTLAQLGVTYAVSKQADNIKAIGRNLWSRIFKSGRAEDVAENKGHAI